MMAINTKQTDPELLILYNEQIVPLIIEKYDVTTQEALSMFWNSETYKMMLDPELVMWEFSVLAIFDMWEVEQVTGDPRNSAYLRS